MLGLGRTLCLVSGSLCATRPLLAHDLEEVLLRCRRRSRSRLNLLCLLLHRLLQWGNLRGLCVLDISSFVDKRLFTLEARLKVHFI